MPDCADWVLVLKQGGVTAVMLAGGVLFLKGAVVTKKSYDLVVEQMDRLRDERDRLLSAVLHNGQQPPAA